ncbi:hypothetical protein Tco_0324957 [Tanacetum coccineum]
MEILNKLLVDVPVMRTSMHGESNTYVLEDLRFELPDHRAQVDQGSQIKMIQVKEMMQDNDLKNLKSKDKGSKSRSQSMDEQSHYKQDKTITRQSINVKRHIFNVIGDTEKRPYALSWKPCQGDSLNLPDHRIHKDGDGDASFQLKSDSLPHAHAQTTKTFYKHQDSRIMKAQELKTKTSAQTLIYKIFLQRYQVYQGRLLESFQDDAKYEHVGQDTRSQGPYTPTMVTIPAVPATKDSQEIPAQTSVETVMNMTPENKAHFQSEKEAIHLILTRIGDEIYSN